MLDVFISPGGDPGFDRPGPATARNIEVGYDLGKSFRGWDVGNCVTFRARPKGINGQPMQQLEGIVLRFERRWGQDYATVRDANGERYDVKLEQMTIADAVSQLGNLLDANDES